MQEQGMRTRFLTWAAAGALFLATALSTVAAATVVVDRVVAVVNGEIITMSDLQREEALKKTEDGQDQRLLLEDMIDRKLQVAAAKNAGMDVTDRELEEAVADIMKRNGVDAKQFEAALAKEGLTLEQYKSELREQMTLSRAFNKFVRSGIAVDEAEVRRYYDRNLKSYARAEEIRVRRIFFRVPESAGPAETEEVRARAQAAAERAKKGEDFVRLVKELSESEDAAFGGDLGFMQRDQVISEIEKATRGLKPGEIAGPVLGAGGYHILKLEEVRTPTTPFEQVKDEITRLLYGQKLENTYRSWLQGLRSDSNIENKL
jgi:peptidyl-prolyl cis-trans isomerase SurA